jgi:hypothetical protein
MPSRYSARNLHRVAASHHHNEAVLAWAKDGRDAGMLPDRDLEVLVKKRDALQSRFADLAAAVATFGADAVSVAKLEAIRSELALVERDLALVQTGSAA